MKPHPYSSVPRRAFGPQGPACLAVLLITLALLWPAPARGASVISKSPNVAVFFGLPASALEFENPLSGTESVLGHPVLNWRDADYSAGPPRWYDDWSVSDATAIDGNATEIWMRQKGHRVWTTTTVASTVVSIHLTGDSNDGQGAVLVDGIEVARLDMNSPVTPERALVMVYGLPNSTHAIEVQDLGASAGGFADDFHLFGAAALGDSKAKWNQPPVSAQPTNIFHGWNQPSMLGMPPLAADDWVCTSTNPVTKIRWWGSFLGWRETTLPQPMPSGFQVAYWSDVPATAGGFSHPGVVLQTNLCTTYTATWVGWDYDPRTRTFESCFLFEQTLPAADWFYQQPGANGTNIFWVSIAAQYPPGSMGPLWGWKTRPRSPTSLAPDAAVMIFDPIVPEPGRPFTEGNPITWPEMTPWDLAFELISETETALTKYEQPPETNMGIDVNASYNPLFQPPMINLLADDFPCIQSGPLTHFTLWASWFNDLFPMGDPRNVRITLSIHTNIPAGPNGWSIPGVALWTRTFNPGEFMVSHAFTMPEGWMDPPFGYLFPNHQLCLRYDFAVPPAQAFVQRGSPQSPAIYWLDVQADLSMFGMEPVKFGWKTSPVHWMDHAVWVASMEPYFGNAWQKLVYPASHPKAGQPLDLAFGVATSQSIIETKWSQPPVLATLTDAFKGWNEPSILDPTGAAGQIVADDWVCTNATPVTDIHWWGSYLNYSQPEPPGVPLGFLVSIWSDVPAQPGGWSHPGTVLWTYYTTNVAVHFAGWDIDPRSNAVPEACFRYDLELPEAYWFHQPRGTNTYWLSLAATTGNSGMTWGWKTRPRDPLSLAPDDAVRIFNPTFPVEGAVFGSGQPIEYPAGKSWDTAFIITTRDVEPDTDYGDAPSPYPTLRANNGASHLITPNVFLGNRVDAEADGQPSPNADGDDLNPPAADDEDGVTLIGPFLAGQAASIKVQASVAGFVSVWIDYNGDGSWLTLGDQVFNGQAVGAGSTTLNFIVPNTASAGINTYARVRLCTTAAPIASPTGQAPDGEVEDYRLRLEALDFGDAPDPTYPTKLANNGARHIVGPMLLGNLVDAENDGQPNANATGDDLNPPAVDDEDGVVFNTALMALVPNTITVTTTVGGYLQAWIDLNADGDWADTNEQVIVDRLLGPGVNSVTFTVPYLTNAPKTFARFRLSGLTGLGYTGLAPDGEVEDYEIKIQPIKWIQEPEVGSEGVDVDNQWPLADDFQCTQSGPITDFHLWGSFRGDRLPVGGPTNMPITLTVYSDVPAGAGTPYSHPGEVLWTRTFLPGTFDAGLCTKTSWGEWWHEPSQPLWQFPGDTNIYQFDFYVDRTNAFAQVKGTIYWLGMKYGVQGPVSYEFGWKTTFRSSWNDDACWLDTRVVPPVWRDLRYKVPHPKAPASLDLAFALSGVEGDVLDFGDAPDLPYPTLLANNGARHAIVAGMQLGALIDSEPNGQPNLTATGDDLAALPDEDGVMFGAQLIPGLPATVQVTASASGYLNAWVDFNGDGTWSTANDQIFVDKPLSGGTATLTFNVPASATPGITTYARFRFSSVSNLTFTGYAPDGEVEDYQVKLGTAPESDLGDAPDSSNSLGAAFPMTAYAGVNAAFPTVFALGSPPTGPMHRMPKARAHLGANVSGEAEADLGVDMDGINNLDPVKNLANQDGADDGVVFPLALPHGKPTTMTVNVRVVTPGPTMYLNVWFDWNRDGDWNDAFASPNGSPAPEWAVQNLPVPTPAAGLFPVVTPQFVSWQPSPQVSNLWMRVTLSDQPWPGPAGWAGAGGDGPPAGYYYGETEDYLVTDYYQNTDLDFGDAPDLPYPTLLARNGARHAIVPNFMLGQFNDAEANGQPNLAALGDDLNPPLGPDDEDGVILAGPLVRGRLANINVFLTGPSGRLDAWIDFKRNGNWTDAGEKIFHNQALVAGNNALTFPVPATARVGETYCRFRLSSVGGLGFTNLWHDGEVEDYRVTLYQRRPGKLVITNITVFPISTGHVARVAWTGESQMTYELWGTLGLSNQPAVWTMIGDPVDWPQYWQMETNTFLPERYYRVVAPFTEP